MIRYRFDGVLDGMKRSREKAFVTNSSRCPVCSSTLTRIHLEGSKEPIDAASIGPSRRSVSTGTILRCLTCGLGFAAKVPLEKELSRLYTHAESGLYDSETRGRSKTALRHMHLVHRYAPRGRLLDIGCATGTFLRLMADAGWTVVGVEPSQALHAMAVKNLSGKGYVACSTLQKAQLPFVSFDAITLWDVLEHVLDPVGFLRLAKDLLQPHGYLFVNVPDIDSLQARILGRRWPLLLPEHLFYFTRKSMRLCGERAGLEWAEFGRRNAFFSANYVLYRLAQHSIPGANVARKVARQLRLDHLLIPVPLGEIYGVGSSRDPAPQADQS